MRGGDDPQVTERHGAARRQETPVIAAARSGPIEVDAAAECRRRSPPAAASASDEQR